MMYLSVSWWLEGVAQIALGCLGFVANAVAIPILLSREMSSIFNRLLTCMAVFDNVFIVCSVLEAVRKHIVTSTFQDYLFGYFLYQVRFGCHQDVLMLFVDGVLMGKTPADLFLSELHPS